LQEFQSKGDIDRVIEEQFKVSCRLAYTNSLSVLLFCVNSIWAGKGAISAVEG